MAQEILQNNGDSIVCERDIHHKEESNTVPFSTMYLKVSWESVLKGKGYLPSPVVLYEYPYQCLGYAGKNVFLVVSRKCLIYDASVLKAKSGPLLVSSWNECAWGPMTEKWELKITLIGSSSDIHFKEADGDIFMKTSCFQRVQV